MLFEGPWGANRDTGPKPSSMGLQLGVGGMSLKALIMVRTEPGKWGEFQRRVRGLAADGVVDSEPVFGRYDVVVVAEVADNRALKNLVERIKREDGIVKSAEALTPVEVA